MNPSGSLDWAALVRLRAAFLAGTAGARDYWQSDAELASYDATFAQRIGWKWDFVLADLKALGWSPPAGPLTDWGCGSGVAGRAFLDHFGAAAVTGLHLWDRSPRAVGFAAGRAAEKFPGLAVHPGTTAAGGAWLLSHVLTELTPVQVEGLLAQLADAAAVLWVEPGTHAASWALVAVRERLREGFHVVAPCLHRGACGLLAPRRDADWCHHFAAPPAEVFTDPDWARFANLMGIDLRSLPVSCLVLDRRPPAAPPPGAVRVLGRPRLLKAEVREHVCDAAGVREEALPKRALPDFFRAVRKDRWTSRQVLARDAAGRVTGVAAGAPYGRPGG